jgi:hypothetical protein
MADDIPSLARDPAPWRSALSVEVAHDLGAILPEPPVEAASAQDSDVTLGRLSGWTSTREAPGLLRTVGPILIAALLGLSAGLVISRWLTPEHPRKHAAQASAQLPAKPAPMLAMAFAPTLRQSLPTTAQPLVAAPKPMASVAVPNRVSAPTAARDHRAPLLAQREADCAGPRWADPRCQHSALMSADRDLREAYGRAVRANVPAPILADYEGRWEELRAVAHTDVGRSVAGYMALASDLRRLADNARREGEDGRWRPPSDAGRWDE